MRNKLLTVGITLMMVFACFIIVPDSVEAGVFTDLDSPNATLRDIMWDEEGNYAIVVGNDSLGNGVTYRYRANDEDWTELTNVSGDSYNAVSKTQPFIYIEDVDNGTEDWNTYTWQEPVEASDLVGHWKLDDGIGLVANDTSQNQNHGTLLDFDHINADLDTPPQWTDGMNAGALEFDGLDDYVNILNAENLTSGSFSGSAWEIRYF